MAITSSSRRRLPSLFSPGKKQWKQAATLNGRPYVVGHVPRSPSYREVEFEGLLHGTTATKVISLTKNPRAQPTTSNALGTPVESPLPPLPPAPIAKKLSGPLDVPQSGTIPTPKSDDMHSDSTLSPSVKKLFRLPATPGNNRKSMMVPAECSTVEFETRMASYSDDEHNGNLYEPESVKQKRRESRDDGWVDILVGSQNRRIGEQDAGFVDRRRGQPSRHSDPDIASLEVAQVLATVQNRTPSPSSMLERVDRDYGMDHHVRDLDVDEVETIPRMSSVTPSSDSEEESEAILAYNEAEGADVDSLRPPESVLTSRQMAKYQRRVGYFDLHPDRRQALARSSLDDDEPNDPMAKYADDSDDDIDDDRLYGPPEAVRPLPVPGQQVQPHIVVSSSVVGSTPTFNPATEARDKRPTHNGHGNSATPSTPTKTAALIELYRERERGSPITPAVTNPHNFVPIPIVPLAPSRLPVRTASLPKEGASLFQPPLLSTLSPKDSPPKPSPPESTLMNPPCIQLEETGRTSPARYVHGTPLHVLQEEEE